MVQFASKIRVQTAFMSLYNMPCRYYRHYTDLGLESILISNIVSKVIKFQACMFFLNFLSFRNTLKTKQIVQLYFNFSFS